MNKKIDCYIIRDLLPSYVDGICSKESKACVEEHVKDCEECKEILYSMMEDIDIDSKSGNRVNPQKVTCDEKEIMKQVNGKFKKEVRKKRIVFTILLFLFLCFAILLVLPVVPIEDEDLTIRQNGFQVNDCVDYAKVEMFKDLPEDAIIYTSDNVDLEKEPLIRLEFEAEDENGYCLFICYANQKWIEEHPYVSVVNIQSKKPIKKYDYYVTEENGKNIFYLDNARTSVFTSSNMFLCDVKLLVEQQIDGIGLNR